MGDVVWVYFLNLPDKNRCLRGLKSQSLREESFAAAAGPLRCMTCTAVYIVFSSTIPLLKGNCPTSRHL